MDKPPANRRVRIDVSEFLGVLTVALCVLWVRRSWWADRREILTAKSVVAMSNGLAVWPAS